MEINATPNEFLMALTGSLEESLNRPALIEKIKQATPETADKVLDEVLVDLAGSDSEILAQTRAFVTELNAWKLLQVMVPNLAYQVDGSYRHEPEHTFNKARQITGLELQGGQIILPAANNPTELYAINLASLAAELKDNPSSGRSLLATDRSLTPEQRIEKVIKEMGLVLTPEERAEFKALPAPKAAVFLMDLKRKNELAKHLLSFERMFEKGYGCIHREDNEYKTYLESLNEVMVLNALRQGALVIVGGSKLKDLILNSVPLRRAFTPQYGEQTVPLYGSLKNTPVYITDDIPTGCSEKFLYTVPGSLGIG